MAPATACVRHPSISAIYACGGCGVPICGTCDFSQPDGGHFCPECAQNQASAPPLIAAESQLSAAARCALHPNVPASFKCKVCGAYMCQTCTFDLPGGIKICPTCATAAPKLSPKRKKLLIASYALAVWCTIVMVALFGGMFRGFVRSKEDQETLGLVFTFLLLLPSVTGFALGLSSMDKRFSNSIAMWIATAWNGVILGGFLLLIIVGLMK